jgi:DNA-directed RNA polymerase specialized sigma subunit
MKKYNIPNYIRYKNDLLVQLKKIEDIDVQYLNQEQLQWKFMLLVENIARKFSTTQQASGVMSINDLIQEGNLNLTKAIDV